MSGNTYGTIVSVMRVVFMLLMAGIALYGWMITLKDAHRAASLRRQAPDAGLCGEFLVKSGCGKARTGMLYPVIREGSIGSSAKCDVRLRTSTVRRVHASFERTDRGLKIEAVGKAKLYNAQNEEKTSMTLTDGGVIRLGDVKLMLILSENIAPDEDFLEIDPLFEVDEDSPGKD